MISAGLIHKLFMCEITSIFTWDYEKIGQTFGLEGVWADKIREDY